MILGIKGTKEGARVAHVSEPVVVKLGVIVHSKLTLLIRMALVLGKSIVNFWSELPTIMGLV
jgi:hypothetical protein